MNSDIRKFYLIDHYWYSVLKLTIHIVGEASRRVWSYNGKIKTRKEDYCRWVIGIKRKTDFIGRIEWKTFSTTGNKIHLSIEIFLFLNFFYRNCFRQLFLFDKKYLFQRLGSTESHSHSSDILSSIKDNQVDSLSKQVIQKFPKNNNWKNMNNEILRLHSNEDFFYFYDLSYEIFHRLQH